MYALVALVILAIAPDKPIQLVGSTRFATDQECTKVAEVAPTKLVQAYKSLGLDVEVEVRCIPTGQQDI